MTLNEIFKQIIIQAKGMSVLYVEDEDLIRENTKSMLETVFSNVVTASNGSEGLRIYEKDPFAFDIVITDILMPIINGVEMIRKLKVLNQHQSFIVTSACEDSNYLLELINLGVAKFLLKPIRLENMMQVLSEVITNIYNAKKVQEFSRSLSQELAQQSRLLEQYKEIVDISMIVSKTDVKGRIIYTNDAFCNISGYHRDELIGKSHNIVRHPDMESEVFKSMWNTIQNKQTWQGTIKNRKKDGSYYITNATIKPIIDVNGAITEFMSIRSDVTDMHVLTDKIWNTQHEMLYLLGEVGETRSEETGNHVRRVAKYSKLLAELYGLNSEEANLLYSASPMHDIGKIGIPDAILLKPGKLDEDEFAIMKQHAAIGYEIFKKSELPLLQAAAIISHEHHEKWNGTGYPRAIVGEEIHIFGRITALVDVFDALSCDRVYKKAWPLEKIIELIQNERGKHFDPTLVDLFITNIEYFKAIAAEFKD